MKPNKFNSDLGTDSGAHWSIIHYIIERLTREKLITPNIYEQIIEKINELTFEDYHDYQKKRMKLIKQSIKQSKPTKSGNEKINPAFIFKDGAFETSKKNPHLWLQLALIKLGQEDVTDKIYQSLNNFNEEDYNIWISTKKTIEWYEKGYLNIIDNGGDVRKIRINPTKLGEKNLDRDIIDCYKNNYNGVIISKQDVVYLHDTKGLTFREISKRANVPRTTLQDWYHAFKNKNDSRLATLINSI